jgi:hypothetical protein
VPSIHALEHAARVETAPPADAEDRVLLVERVLPLSLRRDAYEQGAYVPIRSFAHEPFSVRTEASAGGVEIVLRAPALGKRYRFPASGPVVIEYRWDPAALGEGGERGGWFAPELSLACPVTVRCTPDAERWEYDILTISKSERGLEATVQGRSITLRWPIDAAGGRIELSWEEAEAADAD